MADEQVEQLVASQPQAPEVQATQELPDGTVNVAPEVSDLQAEIDRLQKVREQREKEAREAEEKAVYWRKQKAESRAEYFKREEPRPPAAPPEPTPEFRPPPKPEDYTDYNQFVDALTEYKTDVKIRQWQQAEETKKLQAHYEQRLESLKSKMEQGYSTYPDFEEVARDPSLPITRVVVDILAESESPADVAYYLGKNRAEAIKLSRMTPVQAAKEIARIEDKIMAEKANQPNPGAPKLPSAPPPIRPVGQSNVVNTPLERMSQREFEEEMAKRTGRRF